METAPQNRIPNSTITFTREYIDEVAGQKTKMFDITEDGDEIGKCYVSPTRNLWVVNCRFKNLGRLRGEYEIDKTAEQVQLKIENYANHTRKFHEQGTPSLSGLNAIDSKPDTKKEFNTMCFIYMQYEIGINQNSHVNHLVPDMMHWGISIDREEYTRRGQEFRKEIEEQYGVEARHYIVDEIYRKLVIPSIEAKFHEFSVSKNIMETKLAVTKLLYEFHLDNKRLNIQNEQKKIQRHQRNYFIFYSLLYLGLFLLQLLAIGYKEKFWPFEGNLRTTSYSYSPNQASMTREKLQPPFIGYPR